MTYQTRQTPIKTRSWQSSTSPYSLDTRSHKIDPALEHPHSEVQLARRLGGVLAAGEHVQCRASLCIVPEHDLLACYRLAIKVESDETG